MAFIVKILVLFLLPILLLTCSSHADDDHLPQVRKGDRKLLRIVELLANDFHVVKNPETIVESTVKKTGETIAMKLFGANGKKGFHVGWNEAKWIYSVNKKCEKFGKLLNVTCKDSTLPTNVPEVNCVIAVAGMTGKVEKCSEKPGVSRETPCLYFNGTISLGTSVYQYPNKTCSTK